MFVLQECSICFEDYDAERQPHSIPCGHVFCQPCLDSLVSTSPQCPNCRVSYASVSIRKVICTFQEQESTNQTNVTPEAEALMWQAMQSAIESPNDLKQCKSITQNNPESDLLTAGMPKSIFTALNMMRLLVELDEKNGTLKDKLNTSWAVEESLRDQIFRLETKLGLPQESNCTSSEHFKLLLNDIQKLQAAVETINKSTSEVARHLATKSEANAPHQRLAEGSECKYLSPIPPPTPTLVPEPTPTPLLKKQPPRPGILRKSPPQDTNNSTVTSPVESPTASRISLGTGNPVSQEAWGRIHHRYPSTPTPTKQLMSPPMTPAVLPEPLDGPPLFGKTSHTNSWKTVSSQSNNRFNAGPSNEQVSHSENHVVSTHLSTFSTTIPQKPYPGHLSMPTVSAVPNPTSLNFVQPRPASTPTLTQPPLDRNNSASIGPTPPPVPKPQPRPRTLTALFDFSASSSAELTLRNGQKLSLLPESDANKQWIWCQNESGKTGYVPKSYVVTEE
ncbi:hypothetical protein RSOLAG1IB_10874 [Rhizoctonia solani AG-1 IB]|uniref:SH3 domain-containing protein n=1 Tax=Thanatephorus cucumeris (strain AG1-IB / isolate 7/3/14) TaxID=1108050 RepID=A0A0B7G088_THACB|nr:hypothetical protein RSOLAG1IB_10874 [Rhizoctonia solani AG-1 IB]